MVIAETLEKANIINRNVKRVKVMLSGDVTKAVTLKGLLLVPKVQLKLLAAR